MPLPQSDRLCKCGVTISVALATVYYALFIFQTSFVVNGERYFCLQDDEMISMRYARNLAQGFGLVWNPGGERVEGFTNPLWVLFMAALHLLPIATSKISLLVQIAGAGLLLLNLRLVAGLSRQVDSSRAVSLLAIVFTAFYLPLVNWALQGMEVSILALLTNAYALFALVTLKRGRPSLLLYAFMALGTFVRVDMAVPCLAISAFLAMEDRRNRWRHVCLAAILLAGIFALQTGFRIFYFGDPLPNTYYLKLTGYPIALRLSRGLYVFVKFIVQMGVVLFLVPFLDVLVRRDRAARLLVWIFASVACYSVYVGGDAWEEWGGSNRYVSIAMPCFFVLLARALTDISRLAAAALTEPSATAGAATPAYARHGVYLILAVSALLSLNSTRGAEALGEWALRIRPIQTDVNQSNVELATLLKEITRPDATVAVMMAGAIPYFLERPAIDLLGKADAHIARLPMHRFHGLRSLIFFAPGHLKWDFEWSLGRLRPDVVVHVVGREEARPFLARRYSEAHGHGDPIFLLRDSTSVMWSRVSDRFARLEDADSHVTEPLPTLR